MDTDLLSSMLIATKDPKDRHFSKLVIADYLEEHANCPLYVAAIRKNYKTRMSIRHYGFARWLKKDYISRGELVPLELANLGFEYCMTLAYVNGLRPYRDQPFFHGKESGPSSLIRFHGNGYKYQERLALIPDGGICLTRSVRQNPHLFRLLIAPGEPISHWVAWLVELLCVEIPHASSAYSPE